MKTLTVSINYNLKTNDFALQESLEKFVANHELSKNNLFPNCIKDEQTAFQIAQDFAKEINYKAFYQKGY